MLIEGLYNELKVGYRVGTTEGLLDGFKLGNFDGCNDVDGTNVVRMIRGGRTG